MFKIMAMALVISSGQPVGPLYSRQDFPDKESCLKMAETMIPELKIQIESQMGPVEIQYVCEPEGTKS